MKVKYLLLGSIIVMIMLLSYFYFKPTTVKSADVERIFSRLNTVALSDSNYSFLKPIGDRSKIIAIGESTHGSKEFNQIRLIFFKFLVEKCGYSLFFVEAEFTSILPLNKYIRTGEGDPEQLISLTRSWVWNNYELLDIVQWMRTYNKANPQRTSLELFGVDMRNTWSLLFQIKGFFSHHETTNKSTILKVIHEMYQLKTSSEEYNNKLKTLAALIHQDIKQADQTLKLSSRDLIYFYEIIVKEQLELSDARSVDQKIRLRDKFMADNILWLAGSNQKGLFGAHNVHIDKYGNVTALSLVKKNYTGSYLRKALGERYFAIYSDFSHGYTRATNANTSAVTDFKIQINRNMISYYLNEKKKAAFFLNIRQLSPDDRQILNRSYLFNNLGSTYMTERNNTRTFNLVKQYDGYIYIPVISASKKAKSRDLF